MPHPPKDPSATMAVFVRVAATAWLNHLRCRRKRCRRVGKCLGAGLSGEMPVCTLVMPQAAVIEMLEFLGDTVAVATPERVTACLAEAATQGERDMIAFRRAIFLHHMQELEREGLAEPLGQPFIAPVDTAGEVSL